MGKRLLCIWDGVVEDAGYGVFADSGFLDVCGVLVARYAFCLQAALQ